MGAEGEHDVQHCQQRAELARAEHGDVADQVVLGESAGGERLALDVELLDVVALERAVRGGKVLGLDALGLLAFLQLPDAVVDEHQRDVLVERRGDQHDLE
jgi:hypothetical protein